MDALPRWENAAGVILSCPGPLRRHGASLLPAAGLALPQVLLGSESQLLAFAAASAEATVKLFFAPLPEMFPDARSLRAAWRRAGGQASANGGRLVHLRFGSVRAARVLKGVHNIAVVAEAGGDAPLTASHHPFASGLILPAAFQRLFVYGSAAQRPRAIGGSAVPLTRLPPRAVTADLPPRLVQAAAAVSNEAEIDLDFVSLRDFRSVAWAAGPVRPRHARALMAEAGSRSAVLMPWNMDHPGSIVPGLLERLARLHAPETTPRIVLLPFNYVGQTGIIRRLIARLREAAHDPDAMLADLFIARVGSLTALAPLRRMAPAAWVDGNDPEHWWTLARLQACGIRPILIDPAGARTGPAGGQTGSAPARLPCDEAVWVEAETRCGTLTFPARTLSLRALPGLLATAAPSVPPAARTQAGRARRPAQARRQQPERASPPPAS